MNNYLNQLGVRPDTLSNDEKHFLDENGYLSLGKLLSDNQLQQIRETIAHLLEQEGERAGFELFDSKYIRHPKEEGAERLADLVNKDPTFELFFTHPRVLAGVAHVLRQELKLSSLNYRGALPGYGQQKLHVDWHETVAPGDYKVCNSIWLLDDFSAANGATRLVAGTHKNGMLPQDELEDPLASHPEEIIIEEPAGTVVIFNSHTWHGGTTNHTDQVRRAVHSYFCRRDQPQQIDQSRYLLPETRTRLSEAALEVLAV
ncbi:phytanoyl-CoA dioxygenase family protein [Catalinimonas niigatensis]|uniref:phytanoyl-CoA dioxygenase family protein n=1 Tax=Catalinimonas niigatensis TaxID=1397264 RepID=UPI00266684C4|nr:phytanoyl-CoA dioxygenase family protein [Catalinimonas niigatensis]WPP50381.1 phytanoyl-CoA dioxygenase family protein [Catalinimonas niigatensis]